MDAGITISSPDSSVVKEQAITSCLTSVITVWCTNAVATGVADVKQVLAGHLCVGTPGTNIQGNTKHTPALVYMMMV